MKLPNSKERLQELIFPIIDTTSIETNALIFWLKENRWLVEMMSSISEIDEATTAMLIQFGIQTGFAIARDNGWEDK